MTAQQPRSVFDANSRGIAVLVVAVAVGLLLLLQSGSGTVGKTTVAAGNTPTNEVPPLNGGTSTTTTLPGDDLTSPVVTTTTTPATPPSSVTVGVLNAGGPSGAAKKTMGSIEGVGYRRGSVGNSKPAISASVVYYREGYQAQATAVGGVINIDNVASMPSSLNGASSTDNVVVVLGSDFTGTGGSGATTTTAGN